MDVVFNRVGKRFGQRDALADLSFELQSGEMAFLTGHSGCLLYTSPSPRDRTRSRMPSSA